MSSDYLTPAATATATLVEKKSEFIATLAPAGSEADAMDFLARQRARHKAANHHVWAYRLHEGGRERCSDDGEPAKTAGMPVLGVLAGVQLENCVMVVTRYFGGTLLGTGGLVRAYSGAAAAAVKAARIATVRALCRLALTLPYPLYDPVGRVLAEAGAFVENTAYADVVTLSAVLPEPEAAGPVGAIRELLRGGSGLQVGPVFYAPWPMG